MAKKRKIKSVFHGGQFGGWYEFRYGETRRPVYVPGKSPVVQSVIAGDKRKHVVSQIAEQMKTWRKSPFEHEGPMRAGLRAGLCLSGTGWTLSDLAAADIVEEALRSIGAHRPTFEQGQPEYVHELTYCAHCSRPLGDEHLSGARRLRFCSVECAKAARAKDDFRWRDQNDRMKRSAVEMIRREKMPTRQCEECGKGFRLPVTGREQRFCSQSCGTKHRMRQSAAGIHHNCKFCGSEFVSRSFAARFCSPACTMMSRRMEAGSFPKRLQRHVFDHFITVPVNASPKWLTPERFDELFAA